MDNATPTYRIGYTASAFAAPGSRQTVRAVQHAARLEDPTLAVCGVAIAPRNREFDATAPRACKRCATKIAR
jgi:hypothetical protein